MPSPVTEALSLKTLRRISWYSVGAESAADPVELRVLRKLLSWFSWFLYPFWSARMVSRWYLLLK